MDDKTEAQKHIEDISGERAPDGNTRNIRDLKRSVEMFADELYRSQTHFLLELIQNADDNQYSNKEFPPSFSVEYCDGGLRISCNEDGFTRANVEAICSIGNSTKSASPTGRRYIGKKGIGFKSVFRIATKVWISSGDYKFVLDRTKPLGMITPLWEDFPGTAPDTGTAMHLQLSDDCNKKQLWQEINLFNANSLIFLLNLRQVTLAMPTSGQLHERRLRREDKPLHSQATEIKVFENDIQILHYLVFQHTIQDMPDEENRGNGSTSHILLAFPNLDSTKSRPPSQMMYAFLPIRDCGFKFLIQADFLLAASREDIDESSPWNQRLLSCLPDAFGNAVEYLNGGNLRYTWLQYIPRQDEVQNDYRATCNSILNELSNRSILESESGQLRPPSSLTYIPEKYSLDNGEPLSLNNVSRFSYLSRGYSHSDMKALHLIGVKTLGTQDFLRDLQKSIREKAGDRRSTQWHSSLARILIEKLIYGPPPPEVFELPIIPLRDGRWVAGKECRGVLFFPEDGTSRLIPEELGLMELHPSSVKDRFRFQLFQALGARPFNISEICQAIVNMNGASDRTWTTKSLVSQALFLFHHSWRCPDGVDLWVATDTGKRHQASKVYLTSLEVRGKKFPALHKDYLEAIPEQKDKWNEWLRQELRVSTIPRLVDQVDNRFTLSVEMDLIRRHWPSRDFLALLRDNWTTYSKWLDDKNLQSVANPWTVSRKMLQEQLATSRVQCQGRVQHYPLRETVLPSIVQNLGKNASKYFRVLDIPDSENRSWRFLGTLGVTVQLNITLLLHGLKAAKDLRYVDDCAWFYATIQNCSPQERAMVKKAFSINSLVFVPQTPFRAAQWLNPSGCCWSAPKAFRRTATLANLYPTCSGLFQGILGVKEADLHTTLSELFAIHESDELGYILNLFISLNKNTRTGNHAWIADNAKSFKTNPVFPVELDSSGKHPSVHHLGSISADSVWYIADRPHLREKFRGRIPLLAFDIDQLKETTWIYSLPFMTQRLLSKLAVCKPRRGLKAILHEHFTSILRGRSKYITRLIPGDSTARQNALRELEYVEVYSAEAISVEWELRGPSGPVATSRPDTNNAAAVLVQNQLCIYITQSVIDSNSALTELSQILSTQYDIPQQHSFTLCGTLSWSEESIEDRLERDGVSYNQDITPSAKKQRSQLLQEDRINLGILDLSGNSSVSLGEFSGWPPSPETWFTQGSRMMNAISTQFYKLPHATLRLKLKHSTIIATGLIIFICSVISFNQIDAIQYLPCAQLHNQVLQMISNYLNLSLTAQTTSTATEDNIPSSLRCAIILDHIPWLRELLQTPIPTNNMQVTFTEEARPPETAVSNKPTPIIQVPEMPILERIFPTTPSITVAPRTAPPRTTAPSKPVPRIPYSRIPIAGTITATTPALRTHVPTTPAPTTPVPAGHSLGAFLQNTVFTKYLALDNLLSIISFLFIALAAINLFFMWFEGFRTWYQPSQEEDITQDINTPSLRSHVNPQHEKWSIDDTQIIKKKSISKDDIPGFGGKLLIEAASDHSPETPEDVSQMQPNSESRLSLQKSVPTDSQSSPSTTVLSSPFLLPPKDPTPPLVATLDPDINCSSTSFFLEGDSDPQGGSTTTATKTDVRSSSVIENLDNEVRTAIVEDLSPSNEKISHSPPTEITQTKTLRQLPEAVPYPWDPDKSAPKVSALTNIKDGNFAKTSPTPAPDSANFDSTQDTERQGLKALRDSLDVSSFSVESRPAEDASTATIVPEIAETQSYNGITNDASPTPLSCHLADDPYDPLGFAQLDRVPTSLETTDPQILEENDTSNADFRNHRPIDDPLIAPCQRISEPASHKAGDELLMEPLHDISIVSPSKEAETSEIFDYSPTESLEIRSGLIGIAASDVVGDSLPIGGGVFPPSDPTETTEFIDSFMAKRTEDEFVNTSRGIMYNPSPATMFVGEDTEESRFLGELYVSQLFTSLLGLDLYRPEEHWTSSIRSRNGHKPFDETGACSTFTISQKRDKSDSGKLKDSVTRLFQLLDYDLSDTCEFHIQVCVTTKGLHRPFRLSNMQYAMCREMTLQGKIRPTHAYILARVYDVHTNPQIAFYTDPWQLYQRGSIAFESASSFRGSVSQKAPAILLRPREATTRSEVEKIYEGRKLNSNQIRLLKLEPSSDENSLLKGELIVRSTRQTKSSYQYWAISYVWGSEPTELSSFQFIINDVKIPITESLWTCLRRLRRDGVRNYIWADAICINQADNLEKAVQVRHMGNIYAKAERVIIWMGSRQDQDFNALDILKKLGQKRELLEPERNVQVHLSDKDKLQISAFLCRPWFTRTWTIQELVLGSHVEIFYQNSDIKWDDFMDAVISYESELLSKVKDREQYITKSGPALALHHIRQTWEGRTSMTGGRRQKFPILKLIEMFFYAKSSKPRDKLFAMLSMASDTSSNLGPFTPDYESNDTVILSKYAAEFVKRNQALELLYRAGREKGSKFSSWIPDLMNHEGRPYYGPTISTWRPRGTAKDFRFGSGASLSPNAAVTYFGLHPVLTIAGKMFDCIQSTQSLHTGHDATTIYFVEILEKLRQHLSFLHSYPNTDLDAHWRDDVLIKTLIGDAVGPQWGSHLFWINSNQKDEMLNPWPQGFEQEILELRPGQDGHEHQSKTAELQQRTTNFWRTVASFLGSIPNATLCVTMKGYVGIIPGGTRPTDQIFLAHGAHVPLVIRESPGTNRYELMGECYIHGIMYYDKEVAGKVGDMTVSLV